MFAEQSSPSPTASAAISQNADQPVTPMRPCLASVWVELPNVSLTRTHTCTAPWQPPADAKTPSGAKQVAITSIGERKWAEGTMNYLLGELRSLKLNELLHLSMDDAEGCQVKRVGKEQWDISYGAGSCFTTIRLDQAQYDKWLSHSESRARGHIEEEFPQS